MAITGTSSTSRPTTSTSTSNSNQATSAPAAPTPTPEVATPNLADAFEATQKGLLEARRALAPKAPPDSSLISGTTSTKVRATDDSLSITQKADATVRGKLFGLGLEAGVAAKAGVAVKTGTENGMSSFDVSVNVSMSASAEVKAPIGGVSGSYTAGLKAEFKVTMPEAVSHAVDPASINPFDPTSMPTGTTVTLNGSNYTSTELGASFRALAIETGVTRAEGVSVSVEKTGPSTVRVTAGPTSGLENSFGVGVNVGLASASIGRTDELKGATLKSAEFDLSTAEGAAAYDAFLSQGTLPTTNGPGVSGVSTTERLDVSSTSQLSGKIPGLDLGGTVDLKSNTGLYTRTTTPEGITGSVELKYGENVGLTVSQKFGPDGVEDREARTYSYELTLTPESAAMLGLSTGKDFQAGTTVDLTLTEAQMRDLQTRAATATQTVGVSMAFIGIPEGLNTEQFAISLAAADDTYRLTNQLMLVAEFSGGAKGDGNDLRAVPGEVVIRP